MAIKTIPLPSMSRVVAGSKALLEIPVGPTYQKIKITAGGTALAISHILRMDLSINGNIRMTWQDLQRLMDLNSYWNRSTDTVNEFILHFFRKEFHDLAQKLTPGLGTQDVQTLTLEIQLAAGAPADISLKASALVDTVPQPIGVFMGIREFGKSSSVTGVVEIDNLPKRGAVYEAIHLFKSDISAVQLEVDGVKVIDETKGGLERWQKDAVPFVRVPVTARATHIDFNLFGDAGDLLNTANVQDMRIKATFDSAGAASIVAETVERL
jgi:hypothetical protein